MAPTMCRRRCFCSQRSGPSRCASLSAAVSRSASPRSHFSKASKAALWYVRANGNIRTQLILALGPLTLGMPFTNMMPIFAKDVLHGGAQLQGFLLSAFGIGSLLGALVVASIPRRRAHALPAIIGALVFSLTVFFFGLSHW